jgi:hypothetical protein
MIVVSLEFSPPALPCASRVLPIFQPTGDVDVRVWIILSSAVNDRISLDRRLILVIVRFLCLLLSLFSSLVFVVGFNVLFEVPLWLK